MVLVCDALHFHASTVRQYLHVDLCIHTQVDRDMVRRNEFGWVLQSEVADLAANDLLPPRFQDLAPSFAAINRAPEGTGTLPSTGSMRTAAVTALPKARSASSPAALKSESNEASAMTSSSSTSSTDGLEPEDAKKHSVLRQWLEKQLVEYVAPQAACVAAGLREVIPYGVLALLQPQELQAFLAGKLGA